ncbi:proteasome assembly chaperone family protein [Halalkalirubrum salinum]|uniref:proteasome assembly chaperone family protein n=1 Tax=Halalkalirubrum salinum TaxID=2563889 RepID=UPI0010FAE59B|nr:PAC2 family protein [Halalkalirubrum salinum]
MFGTRRRPPTDFTVNHQDGPSTILLCGFSAYGLAGLTAVDYLVDHLDLEEYGYIRAEGLPSITPFEAGKPRHPIRLFSRNDLDITVLVGELFVPVSLGEQFATDILSWTTEEGVKEIAIAAGIPVPHGPDGHQTYYVATEDFRERRLPAGSVQPMGSGFLDGTNAALIERGMDTSLGVGLFVTPVHAMAPDVEAAIRLVETITTVYDLDVDATPLRAFADEVTQYYNELAQRIEEREIDVPEDRMYM